MSKSWKASLAEVLHDHNGVRSGGSVASHLTRQKRGDVLFAGFRELRELGYRLDDVRQFRGKHMEALCANWLKRGLSASTLQNNLAVFRVFSQWIGKDGMVESSEHYFGDKARRTSLNTTDKSWPAHGIDPEAMVERIAQICPRTAAQVRLQKAFGLRPAESMQIRPWIADQGTVLMCKWGCKGGRSRFVKIESDEQRKALDLAKMFAATPTASMCDPKLTLKQARGHFYRVMAHVGLTKRALGVTAYGNRHQRAADVYREQSGGHECPVRGGGAIDRDLDEAARLATAETLGHSRIDVASNYLGGRAR